MVEVTIFQAGDPTNLHQAPDAERQAAIGRMELRAFSSWGGILQSPNLVCTHSPLIWTASQKDFVTTAYEAGKDD